MFNGDQTSKENIEKQVLDVWDKLYDNWISRVISLKLSFLDVRVHTSVVTVYCKVRQGSQLEIRKQNTKTTDGQTRDKKGDCKRGIMLIYDVVRACDDHLGRWARNLAMTLV